MTLGHNCYSQGPLKITSPSFTHSGLGSADAEVLKGADDFFNAGELPDQHIAPIPDLLLPAIHRVMLVHCCSTRSWCCNVLALRASLVPSVIVLVHHAIVLVYPSSPVILISSLIGNVCHRIAASSIVMQSIRWHRML
jgi:hypothetical protein